MEAEAIERVQTQICKHLSAYRRLTGESVDLDYLVGTTTRWLMTNFHEYVARHFRVGTGWMFPCVDTAFYVNQHAMLHRNRLDDFMNTVEELAEAQPKGVDTSRVRRVIGRQRKSVRRLCTDIQRYAWLAGLREAITQDDRMADCKALLLGKGPSFSCYNPPPTAY